MPFTILGGGSRPLPHNNASNDQSCVSSNSLSSGEDPLQLQSVDHTTRSLSLCLHSLSALALHSFELLSELSTLVQETNRRIDTLSDGVERVKSITVDVLIDTHPHKVIPRSLCSDLEDAQISSCASSPQRGAAGECSPLSVHALEVRFDLSVSKTSASLAVSSQSHPLYRPLTDRGSLPKSLQERIHRLKAMPNFQSLSLDHGTSFVFKEGERYFDERFSCPAYFLDQWYEQQEKRWSAWSEERKAVKLEKRKRLKELKEKEKFERERRSESKPTAPHWRERFSTEAKNKLELDTKPQKRGSSLRRDSASDRNSEGATTNKDEQNKSEVSKNNKHSNKQVLSIAAIASTVSSTLSVSVSALRGKAKRTHAPHQQQAPEPLKSTQIPGGECSTISEESQAEISQQSVAEADTESFEISDITETGDGAPFALSLSPASLSHALPVISSCSSSTSSFSSETTRATPLPPRVPPSKRILDSFAVASQSALKTRGRTISDFRRREPFMERRERGEEGMSSGVAVEEEDEQVESNGERCEEEINEQHEKKRISTQLFQESKSPISSVPNTTPDALRQSFAAQRRKTNGKVKITLEPSEQREIDKALGSSSSSSSSIEFTDIRLDSSDESDSNSHHDREDKKFKEDSRKEVAEKSSDKQHGNHDKAVEVSSDDGESERDIVFRTRTPNTARARRYHYRPRLSETDISVLSLHSPPPPPSSPPLGHQSPDSKSVVISPVVASPVVVSPVIATPVTSSSKPPPPPPPPPRANNSLPSTPTISPLPTASAVASNEKRTPPPPPPPTPPPPRTPPVQDVLVVIPPSVSTTTRLNQSISTPCSNRRLVVKSVRLNATPFADILAEATMPRSPTKPKTLLSDEKRRSLQRRSIKLPVQTDLLQAIRRGSNLKKIDSDLKNRASGRNFNSFAQNPSVQAILERRKFLQADSDSSSSDDSDEEDW